jgi:hypothetical protein
LHRKNFHHGWVMLCFVWVPESFLHRATTCGVKLSRLNPEFTTMFNFDRHLALRNTVRFRSRTAFIRRPSVESLEQRELLATLALPSSDGSSLTGSYLSPYGEFVTGQSFAGGDFLGTLNGTTALATYCVDISATAGIAPASYTATMTSNGTTFGKAVPNAGAIAWLLKNLEPKISSADQEGALQAAIWRVEYGPSGFQLDGADNSNDPGYNTPALIADYKADMVALGTNTATVSSVDWLSPTDPLDGSPAQALVGLPVGTAQSMTLPTTNVPDFNYTYVDPDSGETNDESQSGGNFLGTLNQTTKLAATYCVSINLGISVPGSFNATVENTGAIYGLLVPTAGAISWLVTNLGPKAVIADQQNALQAAIWHAEYGVPGFELDGADNGTSEGNDATLIADYKADVKALGTHTANVASVFWISPIETLRRAEDQGLVALPAPKNEATKVTVTSSANPAQSGKSVTFTASVANLVSVGAGTPVGTVEFEIDGHIKAHVTLFRGKATLSGQKLPVATHHVTVLYVPSSNYFKASSGALRNGEKVT